MNKFINGKRIFQLFGLNLIVLVLGLDVDDDLDSLSGLGGLEGLLGVLDVEVMGDERLHVNLAACHHGQGEGVAKITKQQLYYNWEIEDVMINF